MSTINENNHGYNYKSPKIIKISKSRLSSGKNAPNYLTLYDKGNEIKYPIGNEPLPNKELKKAFSTFKESMIKNLGNMEQLNKIKSDVNIFKKKKNLNILINSENRNKNSKKERNLNTIETANLITISNTNKENELETKINDIKNSGYNNNKDDLISEKKEKNFLNNKDKDKSNEENSDIDSFDIDLNGLKKVKFQNIININDNKNTRNIISQNYFNNIKNYSDKNSNLYKIYASEEIKVNKNIDSGRYTNREKTIKQSDKAVKSISEQISKLNDNFQNLQIESENNENKKNKNYNNFIMDKISKNILITEERKLNIEEEKKEESYSKEEKDTKKQENSENIKEENYYNCSICEYTYLESKTFLPECKVHYLCRRCTKNYYEEIIDDGAKQIFCPFIQCKSRVDLNKLKNFISEKHYSRLCLIDSDRQNSEENKLIFSRIKTQCNKDNLGLYLKRNLIDINSNKSLYYYIGAKETICPFCFENSLFTQTSNYFYKCLNCLSKVCKFCYKEFNNRHIDFNNGGKCRIFHRSLENYQKKQNKCYAYLMQLFFVFAIFFFTFVGVFLFFRNGFFNKFNINKRKKCFKYFLSYFFSIILFIISIPFLFITYPYFPVILTIDDYE